MTKMQARQTWIRSIIKDRCGGKTAEFARAIGKDSSYVSRMLYPAGKKGGKGIGESMVATIIAAFPDASLPPGAIIAGAQDQPTQIFTKERRANDDVTALQIGLESLLLAVLQTIPSAAGAFLDDVDAIAAGRQFSASAGFLGRLSGIARQVRRSEEVAVRDRRRADPAARTRRGKQGQED